MRKNAFTLAEVLISLAIIGIIAALTLPSISRLNQEASIGPRLAKLQSAMEEATSRVMLDDPSKPLKDVDKFEETDWWGIAEDIIDKLLDGLKSAWKSVTKWFGGVWDSLFDRDVNVSADKDGNVSVKGYATGLNWVPYDNFPALLHRGEAVLTAAEARAWRNGQNATPAMAGGITINQYIQSVPQTPVEMAAATEAYFEQARWML